MKRLASEGISFKDQALLESFQKQDAAGETFSFLEFCCLLQNLFILFPTATQPLVMKNLPTHSGL